MLCSRGLTGFAIIALLRKNFGKFVNTPVSPLTKHSVSNVRQKTDARYSYRLDVRLSVCLSVTRWYCVKTARPIVKLSSPPRSP